MLSSRNIKTLQSCRKYPTKWILVQGLLRVTVSVISALNQAILKFSAPDLSLFMRGFVSGGRSWRDAGHGAYL